MTSMFNKYIFNYFKIWLFFNEGERNYKSLSIYKKNHKASLWYKMERGYAKNKKKMTKM